VAGQPYRANSTLLHGLLGHTVVQRYHAWFVGHALSRWPSSRALHCAENVVNDLEEATSKGPEISRIPQRDKTRFSKNVPPAIADFC
jgi:hypothetical protein